MKFSDARRTVRSRATMVLVLLVTCFAPVSAQVPPTGQTLSGRVLKEGSPVADARVVLHRVTRQASGAAGEAVTTAAGRFQFTLPPPDTSGFTVFFTTVDFESVRYFGLPIHPGEVTPDYVIEVFDTTSALPGAVRMARRDLILLPESDGGWQVNEVVRLVNSGRKTLVSRGGSPTWHFPIPEGASDFQAGEGEAPGDIQLMGDRVLVVGSLVPGIREVLLRYRLPRELRSAEIRLSEPVDTLNLFVKQPSPDLEVNGFASTRVVNFENERFVQHSATGLPRRAAVGVSWKRVGPIADPVIVGLAATLLVLAVGSWAAYQNRDRRARGPRSPGRSATPIPDAGSV